MRTDHVFLSYVREDERIVSHIYDRLLSDGFRPWIDTKDILGGEKWELKIQEAIEQSLCVLVCLSENAVDKEGIFQKEISYALEICKEKLPSDIFLIPLRLQDCQVPRRLRDYEWIDLFKHDGFLRLKKAIQAAAIRLNRIPDSINMSDWLDISIDSLDHSVIYPSSLDFPQRKISTPESRPSTRYVEYGKQFIESGTLDFSVLDFSDQEMAKTAQKFCETLHFPSQTPFSKEVGNVAVALLEYKDGFLFTQIQRRREDEFPPNMGMGRGFNQIRFTFLLKHELEELYKRRQGIYSGLLYGESGKVKLKDYFLPGQQKDWKVNFDTITSSSVSSDLVKFIVNSVLSSRDNNSRNTTAIIKGLDLRQKILLVQAAQYLLLPHIGIMTFSTDYVSNQVSNQINNLSVFDTLPEYFRIRELSSEDVFIYEDTNKTKEYRKPEIDYFKKEYQTSSQKLLRVSSANNLMASIKRTEDDNKKKDYSDPKLGFWKLIVIVILQWIDYLTLRKFSQQITRLIDEFTNRSKE